MTFTRPEYLALKIIVTAVKRGASIECAVDYARRAADVGEADVAEAVRVYKLRQIPR